LGKVLHTRGIGDHHLFLKPAGEDLVANRYSSSACPLKNSQQFTSPRNKTKRNNVLILGGSVAEERLLWKETRAIVGEAVPERLIIIV